MSSRADATSRGRLIKLTIILAVLCPLLLSGRAATAQDKQPPAARKFDEFGDIYMTDIKARLDNFGIVLQGEPETRGFIIVYRSRRDLAGLSNRLAQRMKSYLIYNRGIAKNRLVTVDGGVAGCLTQELWIVPPGAAPTPRKDAYLRSLPDTDAARKFDEFYYYLPRDIAEEYDSFDVGGSPDSLESFAAALRSEPRARAYVIAYGRFSSGMSWMEYDKKGHVKRAGRRVFLDPPGTARKVAAAVKDNLSRTFGIAPSRIIIVDGGHRTQRLVELWIVPRGVHAPVATPNAFPRRR